MKRAQPFLCCPALLIFLSVISSQRVTVAAQKEGASIPIIDTHIHLYDTTRPEGLPWPPRTDKVLYRPVLPADFDKICRDIGWQAETTLEEGLRRVVAKHFPEEVTA